MKRSEALSFIRKEMMGHQIDDNFEEQVLTTVEKLGMKPTGRIIGSNHENDLWNLCLYDWEPEDEKK